jgi:hypothetical protein
MSDLPNKPPVIAAENEQPGSSLMRMLVTGLVLIVIGMLAVAIFA